MQTTKYIELVEGAVTSCNCEFTPHKMHKVNSKQVYLISNPNPNPTSSTSGSVSVSYLCYVDLNVCYIQAHKTHRNMDATANATANVDVDVEWNPISLDEIHTMLQ